MEPVLINQNDDKYIDYVKYVMTEEWIEKQFKIVEEDSQFKERGSIFGLIHPFIEDYINIRISMRRANILGENTILMGVGHSNIAELGRNLYELKAQLSQDES